MRKIYMFITVLMVALSVAACGGTTTEKTLPPDKEPAVNENAGAERADETNAADGTNEADPANETNNANETNTGVNDARSESVENEQEMLTKMDELAYTDFDLDIEYADHKDYEAELEKNKDKLVEAKIEDDLNNVQKRGADAFNELYPLVQKLTIDESTTKEDAIKEVLDVFNLPEDYKEFDLEIKFKDGKKIEFEDKK